MLLFQKINFIESDCVILLYAFKAFYPDILLLLLLLW